MQAKRLFIHFLDASAPALCGLAVLTPLGRLGR